MVRKVFAVLLAVSSLLGLAHVARATIPGLRDDSTVAEQVAWLRQVAPSAAPRMQELFPEGEFFTWALTGLAAGHLARQNIDRQVHLELLDEAITRTGLPEVTRRFGAHPEPLPHGTFQHGWRLLLLTERAALTGEPSHLAEMSSQPKPSSQPCPTIPSPSRTREPPGPAMSWWRWQPHTVLMRSSRCRAWPR
ncbi:MAG: hypothetical protein Q4D96_02345 [Propionibacteriaceae bacterium]|nr:hypothetical protein [Propionibacteriaceae bacterium]